jgi:hypothetical protein
MRRKHAQTREYMEMNALRGIVKDGAGTTLYNYFTEFGLAQISVDFVLGTAGTNVQGKVREVLRAIEDNLLGESMIHRACAGQPGVLRQADQPSQDRGRLQVLLRHRRPAAARGHVRRAFPFAGSCSRNTTAGHALDRHGRTLPARRRGHRLPDRHLRHLHHLWRTGEPSGSRQYHRSAALCPPASRREGPLDRPDDRGLDPAGQQAAAPRDPPAQRRTDGQADVGLRAALGRIFGNPSMAVAAVWISATTSEERQSG